MDTNSAVIAAIALIFSFGTPIFIVTIVLWFSARKTRQTHDTMLKLAEKGVPIPTELIATPQKRASSDFKVGIVLLAAGAGICAFLLEIHGPVSLGAIPALMGLGYMIAWKVEKSPQSVS
jgi:Domain of unknown function (DUF6249)